MHLAQQIAFILLSVTAIWLFSRNAMRIRKNILLGKDEDYSDQPGLRWKNLLLLAFGQKKMFRNPFVAILHFFIYELLLLFHFFLKLLGISWTVFGTHRLLRPVWGIYING
jgi:hypothetical protein